MQVHQVKDMVESNGNTVYENNMDKQHTITLGTLVEVVSEEGSDNGLRLYVGNYTRDCDGEPLYELTFDKNLIGQDFSNARLASVECPVERYLLSMYSGRFTGGYSEESLKVVSEA